MEKVIILDFGSQYTQLIARRLRELHVYSEIYPYNHTVDYSDDSIKAIILSGSPYSVNDDNALLLDVSEIITKKPVLGICYGAQLLANNLGGRIEKSSKREYGYANLLIEGENNAFLNNIENRNPVWMSHADSIIDLPTNYEVIARTESIPIAAFRSPSNDPSINVFGVQFHPEVTHTHNGNLILSNFLFGIAQCKGEWTTRSFIEATTEFIRNEVGNENVVLGLSGGVDSTVAALLLQRAIGHQLTGIFIDNGLLRKNEFEEVMKAYEELDIHVIGVDASERFLTALEGASDPERKRKIIGHEFIDVFDEESHKLDNITWLAQGTIYPDVIESVSVKGPSATIKSHHNVGGLPAKLKLKVIETLRMLFKDEVREVGDALGLSPNFLHRHPFPGPGMAIRVLGELTKEKIALNQEADAIYIKHLKQSGWYDKVWQAGTILLPVRSVGVMGDERTYEFTVVLRCVNSRDGMTANWSLLPHDLLGTISNEIINTVKGINRVVYDISTKPPATIEWE